MNKYRFFSQETDRCLLIMDKEYHGIDKKDGIKLPAFV